MLFRPKCHTNSNVLSVFWLFLQPLCHWLDVWSCIEVLLYTSVVIWCSILTFLCRHETFPSFLSSSVFSCSCSEAKQDVHRSASLLVLRVFLFCTPSLWRRRCAQVVNVIVTAAVKRAVQASVNSISIVVTEARQTAAITRSNVPSYHVSLSLSC